MTLISILENYINNLEQQNQRLQQEIQILQNGLKQQTKIFARYAHAKVL